MTETQGDALARWQQRCQSSGLLMTASRRAILAAMVTLDGAQDAVALLVAARHYHVGTRLGSVYRLLRELEQRGLADAYAQPHARLRWQLVAENSTDASLRLASRSSASPEVQQVQQFLGELHTIGLAERLSAERAAPPGVQHNGSDRDSAGPLFALLQAIAIHLGYRLA